MCCGADNYDKPNENEAKIKTNVETEKKKIKNKPKIRENYSNGAAVGMVTILFLIWAFLGLAAFIMSIVCFGRDGTMSENIIGLILSIFTGPLYFIYYYIMKPKGYCVLK